MKRTIAIAISILVTGFLIFTFVNNHPRQFDLSIEGIKYQLGDGNSDFIEPVSINVNGKMKKSITGVRSFSGTIHIENEKIPVPEYAQELEIQFNENGLGMILYRYILNGTPRQYYYGDIFVSNDFSNVTVLILNKDKSAEGTWSSVNGNMITGPANSRSEALEISNRLMKKYLQGLNKLK